MTRIRTLEFLPEIFQTPTNAQFLSATLDQIVNPPVTKQIQGYVGSRLGYGINAKDYYVTEPTKVRTDYQLEPGVVFTKPNESTASDFITYPGIIDALSQYGNVTSNNSQLFESQFYSWDSFTNLDKIINYNEYYWLPEGPPAVEVSASQIFKTETFIVTSNPNSYDIRTFIQGSENPVLTLLRGGTYNFVINQESNFWIQGAPGITGINPIPPYLNTREVFGVGNNGTNQGIITFNVPQKDAQDEYEFPGNNLVDVVSTVPFSSLNGKLLSEVQGIDGVTSLNGLRVLFFNTGIDDEIGYVSNFYDETNFDKNSNILVAPITLTIDSTTSVGIGVDENYLTVATGFTTDELVVGQTITFNNPGIGGIIPGQVYYINSIINSSDFTISITVNGDQLTLTNDTGPIVANINQGLFEEGYYTNVNENFYRIEYIGSLTNPILKLVNDGLIPINEKITATYGNQYIARNFYRNPLGYINVIPYLSAPLDTLYYQDGTNPNKSGVIRLIENNAFNTINVDVDILGQTNYTGPNGVVFTNGMKVIFDGDVIPISYLQGEYYVEGVGTSIQLVPTIQLICPEPYTRDIYIPYDSTPFDIGNYDNSLYVPVTPDYITIARNALNLNAWSRSNRWFHYEVIVASSQYNNNPNIMTQYATYENKAKRPIIEFYPNLKLFDTGTISKNPIDFLDYRTTNAFTEVAGQENYYPDVAAYSTNSANVASVTSGTTTTITVAKSNVTGTLQVGQYITDNDSLLPVNSVIESIDSSSETNFVITIIWNDSLTFGPYTNLSIITTPGTTNAYTLFPGAKIVFANDNDESVRRKVYEVSYSNITATSTPVITLTEAGNGNLQLDDHIIVLRGYNNQGKSFYYDGLDWLPAQQKNDVNQPPLFDVFDEVGISFGNKVKYTGTSFVGNKLFAYGIGAGLDDSILGFPIRYSNVDNVGDISFDVSLNIATFDYVDGTNPITQKVSTGYVHNYTDRTNYVRELGWKTAISPSVQYQVFEFNYFVEEPTNTFVCDISALQDTATNWPICQLYINNIWVPPSDYTLTTNDTSTTVTFNVSNDIDTVVQVLLLSNQVSSKSYYTIPINLSNNPFNTNIETANIGDIRAHYRSIFINNPNSQGEIFGNNNLRDLGNTIVYGTEIIQNSAPVVTPGVFLRKQNQNLFDALLFNSREYINYKQAIVDTVNTLNINQTFTPSDVLDAALEIITKNKSNSQSFFWSDMIPSKSAYITNTYTFQNDFDVSIYPLSKIYDFSTANYNGILVYLSRVVEGTTIQTQLLKNIQYTVSTTAPSLTITIPLQVNDQVIIKEYNQTYGSYAPNTPTKLGLYPTFVPEIVLDNTFTTPTWFIKGHDGSYTKLYGDYNQTLNTLIDFRDQALFEYEKRVYNNLKLSTSVPIQPNDILPGYFRNSDLTWQEFLDIYSVNFLSWVGQNRLDYKTQYYINNNEFSYNYTDSANKIDSQPILQGNWRGVYQYFYDTTEPNNYPWEMLGLTEKPTWWEERYGPSPYTSENLILWNDLQEGINYNNGNPYVIPSAVRPNLLKILPVDTAGNLISPFVSIVGNYDKFTFQKNWKVGDEGAVEFSYRRSSSWPFDFMKIIALAKPANFYNLCIDLDNYKYNSEFNQYLVNNRNHIILDNVEVYGSGTAKTSYLNWIVDYEKQLGLNGTTQLTSLLYNLDVRLIYRLAGFSDKKLLKFYVEKGSPNSTNASLLIPDESYSVLLYDNQPFDKIIYSSVIVQKIESGYVVYGNSQERAYFTTLVPLFNGNYDYITVDDLSVKLANDYTTQKVVVPYGTIFYTPQEVAQFLMSYGANLISSGMVFNTMENGVEIDWKQMVGEYLYWAQTGWETGSIITLNPAATELRIAKESSIVQPLTIQRSNFVLNQNLYPISLNDLSIVRDDVAFICTALNNGDSLSYGQFYMSNFEHGIVFDNITVFDDIIYNLVTGLRQNRITVRGVKSAEWNGTVNASGFVLNQDNIEEWRKDLAYTKGVIVKYKNKYWTSLRKIEPTARFDENVWLETDYNEIQKGLLPNSSTRSYESTLYYNINKANLEQDADLLSFSLIGYRPRDYLALVDLTDITQVNVYKNLLKNKGTKNSLSAFKGANLPQGGIDYDIYENWAIKIGEFGGVLNENFIEYKLNETLLTGNPSISSVVNSVYVEGSQQQVPLYSLYNYGRPITNTDILPILPSNTPNTLFPSAGYVNFNDVKMSAYFYNNLPAAVNKAGVTVPIDNFYVRNYVWLANYLQNWQVYTWQPIGQVIEVNTNLNTSTIVTFATPHNLSRLDPIAIINFLPEVNGYYVVNEVLNLNQITITLTVTSTLPILTGQGLALKFVSQRVDTPADVINLPLLEAEFIKNTVWVDNDVDGDWAVLRKSINYQYENNFTTVTGNRFGSSVAYTPKSGYLIGQREYSVSQGKVFRYTYNDVTEGYQLVETLTQGFSFGSNIVYADQTYVISKPLDDHKIYVYGINNSIVSDDLVLLQTIDAPNGSTTTFGDGIAISKDTNFIYVRDDYIDPTDPTNIIRQKIYVYKKQFVPLQAGYFVVGQTYIITEIGDTDFVSIGSDSDEIGMRFVATGVGSGTGTATQITYKQVAEITGTTLGEGFGKSISTDYNGDTLVVGTAGIDSDTIDNTGITYVYQRTAQNIEVQQTSNRPQEFTLGWTPNNTTTTATDFDAATDQITLTSVSGITVNDPIVFTGSQLLGTNVEIGKTYYVATILGSDITIKSSRNTNDIVSINDASSVSVTVTAQTDLLYVSVNGTILDDSVYNTIGNKLNITQNLRAGDIINVSGNDFTLIQTVTSPLTPRVGVQFGNSVDINRSGNEILIGAPYEINTNDSEGAVYRYTNGGAKYGVIIGTQECNITTPRDIYLNGFLVTLPIGNAVDAANAINNNKLPNISASYSENNNLYIQVIDVNLTLPNEKLLLSVDNADTLNEIGIEVYTQTQVIISPHGDGSARFGYTVKFNEFDSFVVSATVGTRYEATTFDFTDDENLDNDTLFDNNATRFVDNYNNAGAVYMFDYLPAYNESITNTGNFIYAQSTNSTETSYGIEPLYGEALDFNDYRVVIGTPNFNNGDVITYVNNVRVKDWATYRKSSAVVDIEKIQNAQIFSAQTNNTLVNLDYIDPYQGKLLGAVQENLDFISNVDPARYNSPDSSQIGLLWGKEQVGRVWFDTSNVRFVNYHQNDVVYNSQYWGELFPGSDVAIYTWVESSVPPSQFVGTGIILDPTLYSVQIVLNSTNVLVPIYYFWVRNTGYVNRKIGKTLPDTVLTRYIQDPIQSGISYFSPLLPNCYALYNSGQFLNGTDSVMHIGFSTGNTSDIGHSEYTLIRANYADDFLPGVPSINSNTEPTSLYDRLLDSMAGVDEAGAVVPNPFLPKAVQSGIQVRPRQSFFYDRLEAIKNYITYANIILKQFPITEIRESAFAYLNAKNNTIYETIVAGNCQEGVTYTIVTVGDVDWTSIGASSNNVGVEFVATGPATGNTRNTGTASFLAFNEGELYNVGNYWEYVNWWIPGYDDNTKPLMQVQYYADLSTLSVDPGTIITVNFNAVGNQETYILENNGQWIRIGLQNGTIQFKSSLYDYSGAKFGFGENFYATNTYDEYPSTETRYIIRALTETIYIDELLIFRNKSLISLFEYIQTETTESQNFLPWLNKTSLVDVTHNIRELVPVEVFQTDNQDFLAGYLNEVKPYHVIIKDFLFKYLGEETFEGDITDFDLPSQYNTSIGKFVSPQLVYKNPTNSYEYLPTNSIWETGPYNQWFNNYGLSLVGQPNYEVTTLLSYVNLGSNVIFLQNASGLPINGVIQIDEEFIGYSFVDRGLNLIGNLSRGLYGSPLQDHIPGAKIIVDLPAVVLIDGGRNYTEPPKITAYIDILVYPEPVEAAQLEAVMSLDRVIAVKVINPGKGYAIQPEIIIEPASTTTFGSSDVNAILDTVTIYAPDFSSGDLVQYKVNTDSSPISGLVDGQWYYIGLLETIPNYVIAFYTSYGDAVNDNDRVNLYNVGSGTYTLNLGARAYAITSSSPVRENNIVLRYDRTSYRPQVTDWISGAFYGAFFAGAYSNSEKVSSSAIQLQSVQPPISDILASAQGVAFDITNIRNDRTITYSSFIRQVYSTVQADNIIRLKPLDGNGDPFNYEPNASGLTNGFYVGMPVKFTGDTGSFIQSDVVYYVHSIINPTDFTISATDGGPIFNIGTDYLVTGSMECLVGQVVDKAIVTVNYPDILAVTKTEAVTNKLTSPLNPIGTGGTKGFYVGTPVEFVGDVFGNIVENQIYYITTVVDNERFTISKTDNPTMTNVVEVVGSTNTIIVESTEGFTVNDPIIFNNFVLSSGQLQEGQTYTIKELSDTDFTALGAEENLKGINFVATGTGLITVGNFVPGMNYVIQSLGDTDWNLVAGTSDVTYIVGSIFMAVNDGSAAGTTGNASQGTGTVSATRFGNILSGYTYYVAEIVNDFSLKISTAVNGTIYDLLDQEGLAVVTNQKDTLSLINATGSMTMNVSLPVSPGQVNGQLFTFYETSDQIIEPNISEITGLIEQTLTATLGDGTVNGENKIAIRNSVNGTANMYVNMPIEIDTTIGGAIFTGSIFGYTLYVNTITSGQIYIGGTITGTGVPANTVVVTQTGSNEYELSISHNTGGDISLTQEPTIDSSNTYYIVNYTGRYDPETESIVPRLRAECSSTSSNIITCDTTAQLYEDMPVVFSGQGLGGVIITNEYYIEKILSSTTFTISTSSTVSTSVTIGNTYRIIVVGSEDFVALGASSNTVGEVFIATSSAELIAGSSVREIYPVTVDNGFMVCTGEAFIQIAYPPDPATDDYAPVILSSVVETANMTQAIQSNPLFDVSYMLGGYRVIIADQGIGFAVNNVISISGTTLGGTTDNNLTLTVNTIGTKGEITSLIREGTPPGLVSQYYLKVISPTEFEVYSNGIMTAPVSGINFPYIGDTEVTATALQSSGTILSDPVIVVDDVTNLAVDNSIVFTGNIISATTTLASSSISGTTLTVGSNTGEILIGMVLFGTDTDGNQIVPGTTIIGGTGPYTVNISQTWPVTGTPDITGTLQTITAGQTYFITDIDTVNDEIVISKTPNGTPLQVGDGTGSMNATTPGSFALLPEPFYFNQSIVKYNNRTYVCIVSNNDNEFIFGKWEELDSGDRRLNALDRVIGYYQPTVDMPGVDVYQLFTGLEYPNSTYLGNPFAPAQQYPVDVILQDQPFYPTNVNLTSILYDGTKYFTAANVPNEYSAVINSEFGVSWDIRKIANTNINVTDIIKGDVYVMTSRNTATPIYRSSDGVSWTTNGYYTPYGASPYDDVPYDMTALSIAALALNSIAYDGIKYVAVGEQIVTSTDTYIWRNTYTFPTVEWNNVVLQNELFGVTYVNVPYFTGFIAVGQGQTFDYSSGLTETVPTSLILTSINGTTWSLVPSLSNKGLYGVASDGNKIVAVGQDGIIYSSLDGTNWEGVTQSKVFTVLSTNNSVNVYGTAGLAIDDEVQFNKAFSTVQAITTVDNFVVGTNYKIVTLGSTTQSEWNTIAGTVDVTYIVGDEFVATTFGTGSATAGTAQAIYFIHTVINSTQIKLKQSLAGGVFTVTEAAIPSYTYLTKLPITSNLIDIIYANSIWMAVGDNGLIYTSSNGNNWTLQSSGSTENLNGISYISDVSTFTVVGDNNTILQSADNGISWTASTLFTIAPTLIDVTGGPFIQGYGPEELVPGLVSDNLTMVVNTKPGSNWPVSIYGHTGLNVESLELTPESGVQTVYSFAGVMQYPAHVDIAVIDPVTGLSTTLNTTGYTIDWVNSTVTLNTPIQYLPVPEKLRIDIYEIGNGNQLIKSSTKSDPLRMNSVTGWQEIFLDCNYSDNIFNGSGIIRPDQVAIDVIATSSLSVSDSIVVADVTKFIVNGPITFQGDVFGGVVEDTVYYVKSIGVASSSITISATYNLSTGVAGPTLALTTDTGLMRAVISSGSSSVWTDPLVIHNGTKLVLGVTANVTRTKASNNAITTNTTLGMTVNSTIEFSNSMFGGITPHTTYYVNSILDANEFTISETLGGSTVILTDATGDAIFLTDGFAFGLSADGTNPVMILKDVYDTDVDYLVYSIFGESEPIQYGYTVPETQTFISDAYTTVYNLDNFVGGLNPNNAIVEVDGIRVTDTTDYTINPITETLTFVTAPPLNAEINVTSFSNTDRQYLSTQYNITGKTVANITNVNNTIAPPLAVTDATETTHNVAELTGCTINSSSSFVGSITDDELTIVSGYTGEILDTQELDFVGVVPGTVILENISGSGVGSVWKLNVVYGSPVVGVPMTTLGDGDILTVGTLVSGTIELGMELTNLSSGDLPPTGTVLPNTIITVNISGSGSGSKWRVSQNQNVLSSALYAVSNFITADSTIGFADGQTIEFKSAFFNVTGTTLIPDDKYAITDLGTGTNWNAIGYVGTPEVGGTFIYNGTSGTGTGVVVLANYGSDFTASPEVPGINVGEVYFIRYFNVSIFTIEDSEGNPVKVATNNDSWDTIKVIVGARGSVRVTTGINHNLITNDFVRIGGVSGSTQLNNNTYYVKYIDETQVDLYFTPYQTGATAVNNPVTEVQSYISGGYMWLDNSYIILDTNTTTINSSTSEIFVDSVDNFILDTPVYFAQPGFYIGDTIEGGLIMGQEYYIKTINTISICITVSETRQGTTLSLTASSTPISVTQWEQFDVDRLWVYVNGYRVPSSKLYVNPNNNLSILTTIIDSDEVIITSMIPTATPDREIYLLNVNQQNQPVVYKSNVDSRTWITENVYPLDTTIFVHDVSQITTTVVQNNIAPTPVDNIYTIGLIAEKTEISSIRVFNNTTNEYLIESVYSWILSDSSPILQIIGGSYITAGDSLTITTLEGNLLFINGEQISFTSVNFGDNSISGVQRGANNTGVNPIIPKFSTAYGILAVDKMSDINYNRTWNSNTYNPTLGDPLQISTTSAALFLR